MFVTVRHHSETRERPITRGVTTEALRIPADASHSPFSKCLKEIWFLTRSPHAGSGRKRGSHGSVGPRQCIGTFSYEGQRTGSSNIVSLGP